MPINPSDSFSSVYSFAGFGSSGGTTAGAAGSGAVTVASLTDTPIGGAFAGTSESAEGPLTPSVKIASVAAMPASTEAPVTVAMASPKTEGSASASPDTSSGFGLDGPGFAGGPVPKGMNGTVLLAGLVGVGVLGAGWAWKSLVV